MQMPPKAVSIGHIHDDEERSSPDKLPFKLAEENSLEIVHSTRDVLPFFKDPKVKISIWTIIKDSIGKDLSKMSVPVYFNSPLSLL